MKKILLTLLAIAGIMTACSKDEQGPEKQKVDRIVVDFSLEGMAPETKGSNPNLDVTLSQGCHVAFYNKSNKAILATGKCAKGETKVYVTDVPAEDCYVYGLANVGENFTWPQTIAELENQTIPVTVLSTTKAVPQSSTGTDEWTPGVSQMKINVERLYTRVALQAMESESGQDIQFAASNIKVTRCPSKVYPFGNKKCSDNLGDCDYGTENDQNLFNNKQPFELFIPSNGESEVNMDVARVCDNGYNYADNYTIVVPERDAKGDNRNYQIKLGEESGDYIIIIIGTDTRKVVWGASKLEVKSDSQPYSTTVKGYAENEGTNWNYKLTWTGKSSLEGTMINAAGKTYPLSTSGYIEVTSIGSAIPVTFTSTSKLSADQTINIIAQIPDGMSATLPVTIKKSEEEVIEIFFDNANTVKIGESIPLKVKARYSNGQVDDITEGADITIPAEYFEELTPASIRLKPKKVSGVLKAHNISATYKGKSCSMNVTVTTDLTPTEINNIRVWVKYVDYKQPEGPGSGTGLGGNLTFVAGPYDAMQNEFTVIDLPGNKILNDTDFTAEYANHMGNQWNMTYNSSTKEFKTSDWFAGGDYGTIKVYYLGELLGTVTWTATEW